ncbi:MAG: tetratricopeptide repeat protein [Sandaracinaceae bacterium]|nr:tetratricopeptide repeat protein [Sandaracinaceae bacterium]
MPRRSASELLSLTLAVGSILVAPGCIAMRDQVTTLEGRVAATETRLQELEAERAAEREQLDQRLAATQAVLDEASRVLRRNSADDGLRLDALEQALGEARGEAAEARDVAESSVRGIEALQNDAREQRTQADVEQQRIARRLDEVARAAGMDIPARADEIPADADAHFQAANLALRAGEHSRARALFRAFIERYPSEPRADDAQYMLGVSYARQGQPSAALAELRRILALYRTGDVVDKALFDMAEAFVQLGSCSDARDALQALITTQPRSPLVARSRTRLRELTRTNCVEA